jgi:hypothetical protein
VSIFGRNANIGERGPRPPSSPVKPLYMSGEWRCFSRSTYVYGSPKIESDATESLVILITSTRLDSSRFVRILTED